MSTVMSAAPVSGPTAPASAHGRDVRCLAPPQALLPRRGLEFELVDQPFTPQVPAVLLRELLNGYNPDIAAFLVSGFENGFSTGCIDLPAGRAADNLPSCSDAPTVIDEYVQTELRAGRLAGPYPPGHPTILKISPIGLVPKKAPGSFRIIHHLSFPAGTSVNDCIPREYTTVQYGSIDEAVKIISGIPSPYLAKTDVASAFRLIPIHPSEYPVLGFSWRGASYMDKAMPMGCSSSSRTFQTFSDALVWIAQTKFGVGPVVAVLDDFLFIGDSRASCQRSLEGFRNLCIQLNVPLRENKTVAPCQTLCFLGVTLDVASRELRLPEEKVTKAETAVANLLPRCKAQLRTVQACIGLLNFACIAVPLGRPFLRRLHDLCRGVRRPHHRVSMSREARLDLRAWRLFLSQFNGRSLLDQRRWHQELGLLMETDASGSVGLGAVLGGAWLFGSWPVRLRDADICVKELAAVVVAVTVWRERLADRCVLVRCDNAAVVACINTQTSRSPAVMCWLRGLFVTIVLHNILVRAVHVPGNINTAADSLSRGLVQEFRRLRPRADHLPARWSWDEFDTVARRTP